MRKFRRLLFIAGIILCLGLAIKLFYPWKPCIAPDVTAERILKVHPGMQLTQVIHTLGVPFRLNALHDIHVLANCCGPKPPLNMAITNASQINSALASFFSDTVYCCEANREDKQEKSFTLTYTQRVPGCSYPMLWVHFDSSARVNSIYIKAYYWYDDPVIYKMVSEPECRIHITQAMLQEYFP